MDYDFVLEGTVGLELDNGREVTFHEIEGGRPAA